MKEIFLFLALFSFFVYSMSPQGLFCNLCIDGMNSMGNKNPNQTAIIMENVVPLLKNICAFYKPSEVCMQMIDQMIEIIIDSILKKAWNPQFICTVLSLCEDETWKTETIEEYAARILKDKPKPTPSPATKKIRYKVAIVNDIHLDTKYAEGSNAGCEKQICCHSQDGAPPSPEYAALRWGTWQNCDIPEKTLDDALRYLKKSINPDMILWLGDNQDHILWEQTPEGLYQNTRVIMNYFKKYFDITKTKIYPVLGNHDFFPMSQFNPELKNNPQISEYSKIWKELLTDDAINSFKETGEYTMYNSAHNIRIITINTEFCDALNFYLYGKEKGDLQNLEWLRSALDKAEKNKEDVFILGHIPPGISYCHSQWSSRYSVLMDRYSNIYFFVLFACLFHSSNFF